MSKKLTKLSVGLGGDASELVKSVHEGIGSLHEMMKSTGEMVSEFAEFAGIGAAIEIGRKAIDELGESLKAGFETADHIEKVQAALTGLAGSAENAKAIVSQLKEVASTPPFGFDEVAAASKKLLSAGVAGDQIIGIIKNLGDVSVGTGATLEQLTEIFARAGTTGSVGTRELTEAARQGIPIVQALAKQYHVNQDAVMQMATAGKLSFADLEKAFKSMSDAGGRFAGLAASQANTLGGAYEELKAKITFAFADTAQDIADAFDFKEILQGATSVLPSIIELVKSSWDDIEDVFSAAFEAITGTSASGGHAIRVTILAISDAINAFANTTRRAINEASYYLEHFKETAAVVGIATELTFVRLGNQIEYSLETVDTYMKWVAREFDDIFGSMADSGRDIFETLTSDISSVMHHLPELIKGKLNVGDLWKPLTSSLEFHMEELPKIAARGIGGLEGELERNLEHAKDKLNSGLADFMAWKDVASAGITGAEDGSMIFSHADLFPKITPTLSTDNLDLKITPHLDNKLLKWGSGEMGLATYVNPFARAAASVGIHGIATAATDMAGAAGAAGALPGAGGIHASVPGYGGIHASVAPVAVPYQAITAGIAGASSAGNGADMKQLAEDMRYLRSLFTKWDTNPPLAAVTF